MADFFGRRVSKSAGWSRGIASFSAVLLLTAVFGHRLGYVDATGLFPVLAIVAGLAVLSLVLAAYAFSRLWTYGNRGGGNIVAGVLISSIVLIPFGISAYRAIVYPALTDISTDLDDPPELSIAARTRGADMNPVTAFSPEQRKLQLENYPNITGRRYVMAFGRISGAVDKVVSDYGWTVVKRVLATQEQGESTIEALAATLVLDLPVDVSIRLTDEETSTYVDMRSSSRFGPHDFGDNAARIAAFLAALDTEVSGLQGTAPAVADPADAAEPVDGDPADAELGIPVPEPKPTE